MMAEKITLRAYQQEAVEAVYRHLRERDDNPCVVIPTAGGKTPVMARICRDAVQRWSGRVLILAHVKELLEQAVEKLHLMAPDLWNRIGVYSAGLGSRDTEHPIIVAGIQSVYQRAAELDRFDLIIVDEAHLIPPSGEGMYRTFLSGAQGVNGNVRLIGLTATPFRMTTGMICGPDNLLNEVCYEVGVRELMDAGWLCRLRSRGSACKVDTSGLHVRGGEFVGGEAEDLMTDVVEEAVAEMVGLTAERRSVLIFAAGVGHAMHIQMELQGLGLEAGIVTGQTGGVEREAVLRSFRQGRLKYLVNVNVLTTGFDAPNIDCVALLRPTMSVGLYYQMVGRGFRLCDGKDDCLVLDYGGNVVRHGPVDMVAVTAEDRGDREPGEAPGKECPACLALMAAGCRTCPACGFVFPPPVPKHEGRASSAGVVSGEVSLEWLEVEFVSYETHMKRDWRPGIPLTMRVDYFVKGESWPKQEWVCFEHDGYARKKAVAWWRNHGGREPVPRDVEEAVGRADDELRETRRIRVRSVAGEKWDRVVDWELGEEREGREEVSRGAAENAEKRGEERDKAWAEYMGGIDVDDIPF